MVNISELNEEIGWEMRTRWNKANEFFIAFTLLYHKAKEKIDSGAYGSFWTFDMWVTDQLKCKHSHVLDVLNAHAKWMASDEAEKINKAKEEQRQICKAEKEREREMAERQHAEEAQQRAERKAQEDKERDERRAADAIKYAQNKASKKAEADRRHKEKLADIALKIQLEKEKSEKEQELKDVKKKNREKAKSAKQTEITNDTIEDHPAAMVYSEVLKSEFAKSNRKLKSTRYELGEFYKKCRKVVQNKQEGNDPNTGKLWVWTVWAKVNIGKSRTWINRCIAEYDSAQRRHAAV